MSLLKIFPFALCAIMLFAQCAKDEDDSNQLQGEVAIEITDAPIDDANVKSVFVTVAEIKIDGKTFEGFSGKKTIDIKAYQNGRTEALGLGTLEAGSYSNITLVLDYETDVNGDAPGCYVLMVDDTKESLAANADSQVEIVSSNAFEVAASAKTTLVADFDLRKSVVREANNSEKYTFVADSKLNSSVRLVSKNKSGNVKGTLSSGTNNELNVAFVYEKGAFDESTEIQAMNETEVMFPNAVSSAVVDAQGNYQLSFLEEGEYELVFFAYEDNDQDGSFELKGQLQIGGSLGLNTAPVTVQSETDVQLDVSITGLLPL